MLTPIESSIMIGYSFLPDRKKILSATWNTLPPYIYKYWFKHGAHNKRHNLLRIHKLNRHCSVRLEFEFIRSIDLGMPIDYSKWDNLEEYSNSSDEEDSDNGRRPQVTRLDGPSRVTFGGNSGKLGVDSNVVTIEPTTQPSTTTITDSSKNVGKDDSKVVATSLSSSTSNFPPDKWTQKGGMVTTSKNNRQLFWSQDRCSVQLRLELLPTEKVSSVQVDGIFSYADRHCAVGDVTSDQSTSKCHLRILGKPNVPTSTEPNEPYPVILEGDLPHPVHLAQDDDEIDWTIDQGTVGRRFVLVTLLKAVPMIGLFLWWKRPLLDFPEIVIEDNAQRSAASKEFLQAWEQAHQQFREKKQKSPNKYTIG